MNPIPSSSILNPTRSLLRLIFQSVVVAFLTAVCGSRADLPDASDFKRPSIEAAQRALQERYLTWTATTRANGDPLKDFPAKIVWPSLSDGTPAGDFPKDCFYDKELFDKDTGEVNYTLLCYLVADLANKISYLDGDEFISPSYAGRLAGLPGLPTVAAPVFPGSRVNPDNYSEFFKIISDEIKNRNYPIVHLYATGTEDVINAGGITKNGFGSIVESGFQACSTATAQTLTDWKAYGDVLSPRAVLSRVDRIEYDGASYTATFGNIHGRYSFDHSEFGKLGGSAQVYLYLLDINEWTDGRPSNVPLTAQNAPLQKYKELSKVTSFGLSAGGKYFTPEYAGGEMSFVSPCPEGVASNRFGYLVIAELVATPNFKYTVDSLTAECKRCQACQDGSCPAGGSSTAQAGSISYSVPLGGSVEGSAGSISLYSPSTNFLLASPLGLAISAGEGVMVIGDPAYENIPRQVLVPQGLVDLAVEAPFKRYAMRFYDKANQGSKAGDFYQPTAGSEYKKIVVENPGLNPRIIQGTIDLKTSNVAISAPNHGLSPGSYYVMRVDADSGALPEGWTIGRVNRKNLYYIYALSSTSLAFLYFDPSGQAFLDPIKDVVSGQVLKISSPFPFGNVVITETAGSTTRTFNYTYSTPNTGVTLANLVETNGSRVRANSVQTTTVDATHLTEVAWEQDGGGNIITKTQRKHQIFPWNFSSGTSKRERQTLVEETLDPDGAALKTTYTYNADSASGPNYSRLVGVSHPDGSWEQYEYDWAGRATKTYSAYLDSAPSSDGATCRSVEQSSATGTPIADQDADGVPEVLLTSIERILGKEVGRNYELTWSHVDTQNRQRVTNIRCLETGAAWDAASNVRSEQWSYVDGPFSGKPAKQISEAGVLTVCAYAVDSATGGQTVTKKVGVPTADGEDVSAGTQTVTITNSAGTVIDTITSDIASGIVLSRQFTPAQYIDAFGRTTRVNYLDGTFSSTIYEDCCGAVTSIDRDGTAIRREQDPSGFVTKISRAGITERFVEGYTAAGDVIGFTRSTYRKGRGEMPELLVKVETYDPASRLIALRDPRDGVERVTRFTEAKDSSGHWTRSTTAPEGSVDTSILYRDGSVKEEQRGGVARLRFLRDVESSTHDGKSFFAQTDKQIHIGDADSELEWVKQFTDPLGRNFKTEWPDSDGQATGIAALNYFDSAGRLIRQVDADGVTTLFAEDALGNTKTEALDLNRNGEIDLAGPDRVLRSQRTVLNISGKGDVVQTTTQVWEQSGSDQPTAISVFQQTTAGLDSWSINYGLPTHTQQTYLGGGVIETRVEQPDSTVQTTTMQRGHVLTEKTSHPSFGMLEEINSTLDGLDRTEITTDALTGAKTFYTYYDSDLVRTQEVRESATSTGQKTEFLYDNMNRLKTTILPDNTRSDVRYFPGGNVKARFGANTLPVEYTYDRQDRIRTLTTWQHFNDAAEVGVSGAAVTTWFYNARGQVRQKQDNSGFGPKYTYTSAGRLKTRESARMGADGGNPTLTTYSYGAGGATDTAVESGDIMGIYYSNDPASTPKVENRYDRAGRLENVTDASGKRQLAYESGALDTETYLTDAQIAPNLFGGYVLDRTFDTLHRYGGLGIKNSSTAEIYRVDYQNDAVSRLQTVTFAGKAVTYTYSPASTARIAMSYSSSAQPFLSVTQNYDALNRLTARVSTAGTETRSVTYEFDSLNRRKKATRENGVYWGYGYDARGQLNSAVKKDSGGSPIPSEDFSYGFDDIGNRMIAANAGTVTKYTANLLNQYVGTIPPLLVDVAGSADPAAVITVDGVPATTRSGRDFATKVDVRSDTSGPARWRTIEITGVLAGGGANGANRTATETREVYVPQTPAGSQYDVDGNLIEDELWHYSWDAENRLIALENPAGLVTPITGGPQTDRKRLEFSYDSAGRRIAKKVYAWNSATAQWTLNSSLLFLYDGWNLLCELDQLANGSVVRSYAWGSDLSGSLQGAGGIGGLVFATTPTGTFSPIYDGNGNVYALINSASSAIAAELEYDAFGNTTLSTNPARGSVPFRWSTKYTDSETELAYYGLRYYSSNSGRWVSRDPIAERGGLNLYGMLNNDAVNRVDLRGLAGYFFDGTNNDGPRDIKKHKDTNVFVLYRLYLGRNPRYINGVGTNDGFFGNVAGDLYGYGGDYRETDALTDARKFMKAGDKVADIVGFSRGAAMARDFANRLKQKYPCVTIRWMGLFDTVQQVVSREYNENIPAGTARAIQIVAGGERRSLFPGTSIFPGSQAALDAYPDGTLEEITLDWAVHSDVGGGYDTNRGTANYALRRVRDDGVAHGVPFAPIPAEYVGGSLTPHDSRYITDRVRESISGRSPRTIYSPTPENPSSPFHL